MPDLNTDLQYRVPEEYTHLFIGMLHTLRFTVYKTVDEVESGMDLTQFDSGVYLQFYASPDATSLLGEFAFDLQSDAADLVPATTGVQARAQKAITLASGTYSPGVVIVRLVGKKSTPSVTLLGDPWRLRLFPQGPA